MTVRLLLMSWCLTAIVLTALYGGIVFTFMTISVELGRIDTISDLAHAQNASRIQVIGLDNGFYTKMIKVLARLNGYL